MDSLPDEQLSPEDRARIKYLYAGEVKYCDQWIGELLRGLEERGLAERTLVLVTADHGEGLWDHGQRAHGRDLYEEMIRVPLILRNPILGGQVPKVISQPVSLLDVAPTVLQALGLPPPRVFEGADLAPLLRGEARGPAHDYILAQLDLDGWRLQAMRHGRWKLIRDLSSRTGEPVQLFDLATDPGETANRVSERRREASRLAEAVKVWTEAIALESATGLRIGLAEVDRETLESLHALGYIGDGEFEAAARKRTAQQQATYAAMLNFDATDYRNKQIVSGFFPGTGNLQWMSPDGAILVRREQSHTRWRVDGWIDLKWYEGQPLKLTVQAGPAVASDHVIRRSGPFSLSGELPPASEPILRLDLKCDRFFRGTSASRELCVMVRSVGVE